MGEVWHWILTFLIYFFSALGVIIFLVITHELGHFIAARLAGVKCPEFFVGFGPRIWSTKRGDTEFGVKWILAGGYVKVLGMNPEEEISPEDFPHSYKGVSCGKRFWIIFSGSLVHVLLALLIIFFAIWLIGYPNPDERTTTLISVGQYMDETQGEETPAYMAGLQRKDTLLAMDGQEVSDWEEVSSFIKEHPGQEVTLLIERDGQPMEVQVQLATLEDGTGYLGISTDFYMEQYSFLGAIGKTGEWWWETTTGIAKSIGKLFSLSTFKQLLGISPPTEERPQTVVGITYTAGQLLDAGVFYLLYLLALVCLFLAYINLVPLPPLDGGHLAVLGWERITGREVDMRKLYPVAVAVLAFFVILFILTLRLDIMNIINPFP
jgi:membrane-associated protease RseP (regulator of RpoE activity)